MFLWVEEVSSLFRSHKAITKRNALQNGSSCNHPSTTEERRSVPPSKGSDQRPTRSRVKHFQSGERINRGAIDYFSQIDIFIWSMRHGEQARTISVGRDSLRGVEANLQQPGTHLETRRFARHRPHTASQRFAERLFPAARAGLPFLQNLPFQRNAFALATV